MKIITDEAIKKSIEICKKGIKVCDKIYITSPDGNVIDLIKSMKTGYENQIALLEQISYLKNLVKGD